jgi:opacity protein-like surface antigen
MRNLLVKIVLVIVFGTVIIPAAGVSASKMEGKLGMYVMNMSPRGEEVKIDSKSRWGFGINGVLPSTTFLNLIAGVLGFEGSKFFDETIEFYDDTGLRIEHQTNQNYARIFIGPRIGIHGTGFFRPHAGINGALILSGINTDVVVPDDYYPEKEIRQLYREKNQVMLGYDITLGVDLNFSKNISLDGGVKYLNTFSKPKHLGRRSERVFQEYFEIYVGLGAAFDISRKNRSKY